MNRINNDNTSDDNIKTTDNDISDKYLTCAIGGSIYGIDISYVTEIIGMPPITPVPQLPFYMKGIINLRGRIIPVIDMRLRFSMESIEYSKQAGIVVLHLDNMPVGMIVEVIMDVQSISEQSIIPLSPSGDLPNSKFLLGVSKFKDNVMLILDMTKFTPADKSERLQPSL